LQDVDKEIGGRIKKIRGEKGITQDQLAELAGLNRVHLYRLESGRQSMTIRTLKIIADALETRMRDIIGNLWVQSWRTQFVMSIEHLSGMVLEVWQPFRTNRSKPG
jgi:transcriptional regulator with XRE-family HTH domain